ncbi:MarR family winged helix-turn-helix transcriptional regulator [Arthrobacter sp. MDT1-65]
MSNQGSPDPSDPLAYLLKHAFLRLAAIIDTALEPLGIDGKDFGVLRLLAHRAPTSQLEVARLLGVDRTTMVSLLDELEHKGILERTPDPADRRRNVIALTEQGVLAYDAADIAHQKAEKEFLAVITPAMSEQLRAALRSLHRHQPLSDT